MTGIRISLLSFLLGNGLALPALAEVQVPIAIDIPEQTLTAALNEWARQTGLMVLAPEDGGATATKVTGVKGKLTPAAAMERLLEGSRYRYRFVNERTVTVYVGEVQGGRSAEQRSGMMWVAQGNTSSATPEGNGAEAQPPQPRSTGAETQESEELTEIVVTAQKRKERLIDTPQSVSVLSSDTLAKLGAVQFRDFANTIPGLNFTTSGPGFSQVSMRGVTMGFDAGSTIGIYIDEVPFGATGPFVQAAQSALDMGLSDVERIEVLRGPQGTIYGASAMGGLIKYVTRAPDTSRFGVEAQAGLSTTQHGGTNYDAAAAVNVPFVADKVAMRASAFEAHDGGYIDNVATGRKDVNRSDVYGGRLDLLFKLTDALALRLTGFAQNISRDGEGTANYAFTGEPLDGSLDQFRLLEEPFDQHYRVGSATLSYDMDWGSLISISSYQTTRMGYSADISRAYIPVFEFFFQETYGSIGYPVDLSTDKFTQEVRLSSKTGVPLEWQLGAFYTHESTKNLQRFLFNDTTGTSVPSATDRYFFYDNPSKFKEYAAFGDLTWHVTEKFEATGGLRYASSDQQTTQEGHGIFVSNQPTSKSKDSAVTYLATARYHFNLRATGYLRYATGYRPGGPNLAIRDGTTGLPVGQPAFEPDRLKSYEAGFKAETANRRLGIDLAAYHIDWDDVQMAVLRGGFGAIANVAGGASIDGAEVSLNALPARGFTLTASLAYQDAQINDADTDLQAAEGERLPNVPRFTGAFSTDYELPVGALRPSIGATVRHIGSRPISFDGSVNFPQYQLPSYTSVDLRAGFAVGSANVQLYVHNAFDERGQLSVLYPQFGARVAALQPRTIGISVRTSF